MHPALIMLAVSASARVFAASLAHVFAPVIERAERGPAMPANSAIFRGKRHCDLIVAITPAALAAVREALQSSCVQLKERSSRGFFSQAPRASARNYL